MLRALRGALVLCVIIALVPFASWLLEPGVVLTLPERDPTGVLQFAYTILGSRDDAGTLSTTAWIVWFYGLMTLAGVEAAALAGLLLARVWRSQGVPALSAFLATGALYFGACLITIPHGRPAWLRTWLLGPGSMGSTVVIPVAFGLGLASLVRFSARFPKTLTAEDVRAYHAENASWRQTPYRRGAERVASAYHTFLSRLGSSTNRREETARRAERAFRIGIEGFGVWITFPVAMLLVHLAQAALDIGALPALMAFPIGLSALYVSFALFAVQKEVASPENRRRVAWVASGTRAALFLWVVFGLASYAVTWRGDGGWQLYLAALFVFGPLLMAAALVTALGAAVLLGAVDPNLAVRKTTVYATLVLCFAFLFALVEEWFAAMVVDRFGVSDGVASVLLGATVAVCVTPLKSSVDRLVGHVVGERDDAGGP